MAGVLRSFSYAAELALEEATAERPDDRQRVAPLVAAWRRESEAAFMAAYREAANASVTVPQDPEDAARLIQLFLMEKALYEVRYELDTRPEWLRIPIAGLFETLQPENPAA